METQVHFRIDKEEKAELESVFKNQGLSANDAIKAFIKKSIKVGGFPFELSEPSDRLKQSMNSRDYVSFDDPKEGLRYLNDL